MSNMLTGAILAGGKNKRMEGKVKALLPFFGERLIQKQVHEMSRICDEVIVVTNEPELFLPVLDKSVRIITDYIPRRGPLSGMHAALSLAKNDHVWIVGCHMPFISASAAESMLAKKTSVGCDAVVPMIQDKPIMLHSIYDKKCADVVSALLQSGEYRTDQLLNALYWMELRESFYEERSLPIDFVYKIDSSQDYIKALDLHNMSLSKQDAQ